MTQRKKLNFAKHPQKRQVIFFLLMGLAGSIPLTFTLVQRGFYLGPSLPFFALAFSLFVAPYMVDALKQFSQKALIFNLFRAFGISLLIWGLIYTGLMAGKTGRDHDTLHDTYLFGEIIEEGTRIRLEAVSEYPLDHWRLELYLSRYFEISLGAQRQDAGYIILGPDLPPPDDEAFKHIPLNTQTYQLYQQLSGL
jgi:hypothetical protein